MNIWPGDYEVIMEVPAKIGGMSLNFNLMRMFFGSPGFPNWLPSSVTH
jgi:hypothetical protein